MTCPLSAEWHRPAALVHDIRHLGKQEAPLDMQ